MSLFSGFPSLQQYFDVEIFRAPSSPLPCSLHSAGTETENICNLHNSGAVQDPEPLPSRFENVPPAFKSFAGKKKTKKTKKLPTYCVFCKVRQLIEYTFIESSITSNIPVCPLSRNAEWLLWNIVKFEHYQNILQHFNNMNVRTTTSRRRCTRPTC